MIVAVSGPTGAGKTSFVRRAVALGHAETVVAHTTRKARPDEIDGQDYHFVSKPEFQRWILEGTFFDWDYTIGNYYGYTERIVEYVANDKTLVIAVLARMALRMRRREAGVRLVFLDDREQELQSRTANRALGDDEALLRHIHAAEEREHSPLFDVTLSGAVAVSNAAAVLASLGA